MLDFVVLVAGVLVVFGFRLDAAVVDLVVFDCAGCPLVFGVWGWVWVCCGGCWCLDCVVCLVRCIYCGLVLVLVVRVWVVLYLLEVSLCLRFVSYCL